MKVYMYIALLLIPAVFLSVRAKDEGKERDKQTQPEKKKLVDESKKLLEYAGKRVDEIMRTEVATTKLAEHKAELEALNNKIEATMDEYRNLRDGLGEVNENRDEMIDMMKNIKAMKRDSKKLEQLISRIEKMV